MAHAGGRTKRLSERAPHIPLSEALEGEFKIRNYLENKILTRSLMKYLLSSQQYNYIGYKIFYNYDFDKIAKGFNVDINGVKIGYKRAVFILLGYIDAIESNEVYEDG